MSNSPRGGASRLRPGRALLLVIVGTCLAATAGFVVWRSQPADDFGTPVATAQPSQPAPAGDAPARVPVSDGKLTARKGTDQPARLRIPGLKLDATVDAVGIDQRTGDFAVPPSVDRVGWYRFGPGLSAEAGSIVIAGHVDSAAEGEGAFYRLGSLEKGDKVTLTGPDGESRTFEVSARQRYRKTAIPLDKYFARDGEPRLTLITCGGPFDPETRHYRDNVVVTALPA